MWAGPSVHKWPLNVYDSFSPRIKNADQNQNRLFGNRNIGLLEACNLNIPCEFGSGCEATITDWYARTNVTGLSPDAQRAWEAWTHGCTVTLIVGTRPVHQLPLSDLIDTTQRLIRGWIPDSRHGMPMSDPKADISGTCETATLEVAMRMAHQNSGVEGSLLTAAKFWQGLDTADCDHWVRMASIAMSVLQQPVMTLIPERQNFSVRIDHESMSQRALAEVLPTNIAPQALVWVHLAGFARRY